jgi:serine/threonine protein kinase
MENFPPKMNHWREHDWHLNEGHFALVYKGSWNGTDVALKQLKREEFTEFEKELEVLRWKIIVVPTNTWLQFQKLEPSKRTELHVIESVNGWQLLRLLGVWTDAEGEMYIVTEFVSGGALHNYLAADPDQFSADQLVGMYVLLTTLQLFC